MKKSIVLMSTLAAGLACAASALAGDLPTPGIQRADPQMIYPGQMPLDSNGLIVVNFSGHDLGPADNDNGHPAGWRGGYQHIFIRGVSAANVAGAWVECRDWSCNPRGVTGIEHNSLSLGLSPKILSQPGGHLQVKVWVSAGANVTNDPAKASGPHSDWSPIYTIDIAPAGAVRPVASAVSSSASSSATTFVKKAITLPVPAPKRPG